MRIKNLKIILFFSFILSSLFLLPYSSNTVHAQNVETSDQIAKVEKSRPSTNPEVPNTLHNWTQTVMIETMSALTCQIAGVDPVSPNTPCLGIDQEGGKIGFLPQETVQSGGAIGFMGGMIAALYTPPLHTSDYFQSLASNFGIVKNAQAQTGTGFDSLNPLVDIWTAFRNIVYLFLVIIFIVIGLAIMLRVKIDPRTVMTIQNQIPKILIGILLVTFSFAIAGFLIDIMWLLIYLLFELISPAADINDFNPSRLTGKNPFTILGDDIFSIPKNAAVGIGSIIASMFGDFGSAKGHLYAAGTGATIGTVIGAILTAIIPPIGFIAIPIAAGAGAGLGTIGGGPILGVLSGILAFIAIMLTLLIALFRLWFTLLVAYVQILLAVVLAPFWIIGGIVPGSPISFSGWIKDIAANLLAFPTTLALFMFAKIFMDIFGTDSGDTKGKFIPPLIGNPADANQIGGLIGLGVILLAPNVVSMLQQALKSPKVGSSVTGAIGSAGGITSAPGKLGQAGLAFSGMRGLPGVGKLSSLFSKTS
jgi:hypothetical protein